MEVRHGQEIATTRGKPALTRLRLTLGTVSIATRVIGVVRRAAVVTLGNMATEGSGATRFDGAHGTVLDTAQAMPRPEGVTVRAEELREFHARSTVN